MSSRKRIVICGGGAIGAAIAYFTSRRGARPVLIERHEVAGAASGKSGGFLALDWCRGTPVDQLAQRRFEVHAELSSELGNPWGYRSVTTYAGYAAEHDAGRIPGGRPWLSEGVAITSRLGSVESTALVEPCMFTRGLMHAAEMQGAELRRVRSSTWRAVRAVECAASRSREARSSKAMPSSSRWGLGRSWLRAGCRCRQCWATRAIVWCLKPAGAFPPRHCSSSTARRVAK